MRTIIDEIVEDVCKGYLGITPAMIFRCQRAGQSTPVWRLKAIYRVYTETDIPRGVLALKFQIRVEGILVNAKRFSREYGFPRPLRKSDKKQGELPL